MALSPIVVHLSLISRLSLDCELLFSSSPLYLVLLPLLLLLLLLFFLLILHMIMLLFVLLLMLLLLLQDPAPTLIAATAPSPGYHPTPSLLLLAPTPAPTPAPAPAPVPAPDPAPGITPAAPTASGRLPGHGYCTPCPHWHCTHTYGTLELDNTSQHCQAIRVLNFFKQGLIFKNSRSTFCI